MVQRLVAVLCGPDGQFQPVADFLLANELAKLTWTQPVVKRRVAPIQFI
jgi:hypothetical protein